MNAIINNQKQLLSHFDAESKAHLEKMLYKATDCGMWIEFSKGGIVMGSIVEGCDFGTACYPLSYPFTGDDIDARVKAIEVEATALWKWANEENEEGETDAELGCDAPDVDWDYLHLNPEGRSS